MTVFSIDVARDAGTVVATVSGDVDLSSVPTLLESAKAALADPQVSRLVLDLAALAFIDSTGLGCLVEISQVATAAGKSLALRSVPREPARVIELGGLTGFFEVQ